MNITDTVEISDSARERVVVAEFDRGEKAADALCLSETRKNARPYRNRALLTLLYYTGLRVSELVELDRDQYDGKHLRQLKRKGRKCQDVYLVAKYRAALDDYFQKERKHDDPDGAAEPPLLTTQGAKHL